MTFEEAKTKKEINDEGQLAWQHNCLIGQVTGMQKLLKGLMLNALTTTKEQKRQALRIYISTSALLTDMRDTRLNRNGEEIIRKEKKHD